jgi:hypothetical protein
MKNVVTELGLTQLTVVYPGSRKFQLSEEIEALPVGRLSEFEFK